MVGLAVLAAGCFLFRPGWSDSEKAVTSSSMEALTIIFSSQKDHKMEKRFFQVLDEINKKDEEMGTDNIRLCPNMVAADYTKRGTIIKMGVPGNVVMELLDDSVVPMLILIHRDTYLKIKKQIES